MKMVWYVLSGLFAFSVFGMIGNNDVSIGSIIFALVLSAICFYLGRRKNKKQDNENPAQIEPPLPKEEAKILPKNNLVDEEDDSRDIDFFSDRLLNIRSINFFGPFSKSSSDEWIVAWKDGDGKGTGGYRESGNGLYLLYNTKSSFIFLKKNNLERPNNGSVSDNGSFSIEDWHFGNGLKSTLYVFSSSGQELISRKFSANIFNSKISKTGKFAVCQTANSSSNDGSKLTLFDVDNKRELFSIHPESGWADDYDFNESARELIVKIRDTGSFRYDFEGNFLDEEAFSEGNLNSSSYSRIIMEAQNILDGKDISEDTARKIIQAVDRAISLGAENDKSWYPHALKAKGIAFEYIGKNHQAILIFEEALSKNPKIGVKRRMDALKKKLDNPIANK